MGRLPGFDYKRPFFYMVTLKRAAGLAAAVPPPQFSKLERGGKLADTALTPALRAVVERFHETWWCIERIRYYVIMPDHLHLIIKMREVEGRVSLAVVVRQLLKALERAAGGDPAKPASCNGASGGSIKLGIAGAASGGSIKPGLAGAASGGPVKLGIAGAAPQPIFEHDWHDWIVKKEGQLAAFRRYIAENGPRAWLRRENRRYFTRARQIAFRGVRYWAYGNEALLELPTIVAIKGHRGVAEEPPPNHLTAAALRQAASRIGPGGAGLSTFLSPLEKEAGNAIVKAGGALIVLSMQGFAERWHPTEKQERLCATGRMLYLSPYEPQAAKLSKREMYVRAHALVDWALEHSHCHLEAWP